MERAEPGEGVPRCSAGQIDKGLIVPLVDIFSCANKPRRFFLEIFAGSARLTAALRGVGLLAYAVDICLYDSHNVLDPSIERRIFSWIVSGRVSLVWAGMPSTTFSRARKHDGLGPAPLRKDGFLWGIPWLTRKNRAKVQDGNNVLAFLLRLLYICHDSQVPYVVENPCSSMLWEMPTLQRFCHFAQPRFVTLDHCAFGEKWKKRTTLLYNFIQLQALGRQCKGRSGICSFTGHRHIRQRGVNCDNAFMSLQAQPYPQRLCKEFADLGRAQLCG